MNQRRILRDPAVAEVEEVKHRVHARRRHFENYAAASRTADIVTSVDGCPLESPARIFHECGVRIAAIGVIELVFVVNVPAGLTLKIVPPLSLPALVVDP